MEWLYDSEAVFLRLAFFRNDNARVSKTNQIDSVNNYCPAAHRAKLNNTQIADMKIFMMHLFTATDVLRCPENLTTNFRWRRSDS